MSAHVEPHEHLVEAAVGACHLVESIEHLGPELAVRLHGHGAPRRPGSTGSRASRAPPRDRRRGAGRRCGPSRARPRTRPPRRARGSSPHPRTSTEWSGRRAATRCCREGHASPRTLSPPPISRRRTPPGRSTRKHSASRPGWSASGTQWSAERLITTSKAASSGTSVARCCTGPVTNDWLAPARVRASSIIEGWASSPTTWPSLTRSAIVRVKSPEPQQRSSTRSVHREGQRLEERAVVHSVMACVRGVVLPVPFGKECHALFHMLRQVFCHVDSVASAHVGVRCPCGRRRVRRCLRRPGARAPARASGRTGGAGDARELPPLLSSARRGGLGHDRAPPRRRAAATDAEEGARHHRRHRLDRRRRAYRRRHRSHGCAPRPALPGPRARARVGAVDTAHPRARRRGCRLQDLARRDLVAEPSARPARGRPRPSRGGPATASCSRSRSSVGAMRASRRWPSSSRSPATRFTCTHASARSTCVGCSSRRARRSSRT